MRRKKRGARKEAHGTARQFDPPAWLVHYSNGKAVTASVISATTADPDGRR